MASRGPGKRAVWGSVLVHGALVAAFLFSGLGSSETPPLRTYRVSIVSPPPQAAGEPAPAVPAAEAESEPEPAEAEPEVVTPPVKPEPAPPTAQPKPKPPEKNPEPKPAETKPAEKPATKPAESKPSTGPKPDPKSPGGDNLNVNIEGEAFPFPGYLENIIRQVRRYFRWTGASNLRAEVYFVIKRDGTVEDIRILKTSGNRQFDFEALGAIEVAGNRKAFGALPDGFQGDRLPVSFFIDAQ